MNEQLELPGVKPVVHFRPIEGYDFVPVVVGQSAIVYAIAHPRLGSDLVRTSRVVKIDAINGSFETLNTVYVPAQ